MSRPFAAKHAALLVRTLLPCVVLAFGLAGPPAARALPSWVELNFPDSPSRVQHLLVVDGKRHRGLMFGGLEGGTFRNDVWSLELEGFEARWVPLATLGVSPSPRQRMRGFLDNHDRLVFYGGEDAHGACGDVWALTLAGVPTWTRLAARGTGPTARVRAMPGYDARRDRLILFGGYDAEQFDQRADVWAFDLSGDSGWTQLHAGIVGAPTARFSYVAACDSVTDRLVIAGGAGSADYSDTWGFDLAARNWAPIAVVGSPPGGQLENAGYDAGRRHLHVFGPGLQRPMLSFADMQWLLMTESGETPGTTPPRAWDATTNRVLSAGLGARPTSVVGATTESGTAIHYVQRPNRFDEQLSFCAAEWDSVHSNLVVVGGVNTYASLMSQGTESTQAQAYSGVWRTKSVSGSLMFEPVQVSGTGPGAICQHRMVYDSNRGRFLVFGGSPDRTASPVYDGVWVLTMGPAPTWSPLVTTGPRPSGRVRFSMVFDPVGDRVIVYGGATYAGTLSDIWELRLSPSPTWVELHPTGPALGSRAGHGAGWDRRRNRMLIYGGNDGSRFPIEVWQVDFSSGAPVSSVVPTTGPAPGGLRDGAVLMDVQRDRLVVDGGHRNETWDSMSDSTIALQLGATGGVWEVIAQPQYFIRDEHAVVYDRTGNQLMWINGHVGVITVGGRVWTLALPPLLDAPEPFGPARGLTLRVIGNGSRGRPSFACTLTEPGAATLELFDVSGRRVGGAAVEGTIGTRAVAWPSGVAPAAGLYFAHLRQGRRVATARSVVLP